jgi:nucleoside-diphosphate-sugar epimerase
MIQVVNYGENRGDFTYIDDTVEGVIRVLDRPSCQTATGKALLPIVAPATSVEDKMRGFVARYRDYFKI